MEDAIYGGRIDNPMDLRVLRSYLSMFFSDRIASEQGNNEEVIYGTPLRMPKSADFETFRKVISQLQDIDSPFIFNLPDNIERSLQRLTSALVIKQLKALSAHSTNTSKFDKDLWRAQVTSFQIILVSFQLLYFCLQLSPVLDLWQLLSSSGGVIKSKAERNVPSSSTDSVTDFIWMENEAAAEMCSIVDSDLRDLKKVLYSTGLLTPHIQSLSMALLSDTVPHEWNKKWESGPEKPLAWLRELVRRRLALMKWKTAALKSTLLDDALSLRDLFNPATFVNALRQQTARKLDAAIDRVKLFSSWDQDTRKLCNLCPMTCRLGGLLLQGASFPSGILRDAPSDASELSPAPVVSIGFVLSEEDPKDQDMLLVPLYLTPSRESLLIELRMPVSHMEDCSKYILSGIALFLSDDE